jgi:hypothetical protein
VIRTPVGPTVQSAYDYDDNQESEARRSGGVEMRWSGGLGRAVAAIVAALVVVLLAVRIGSSATPVPVATARYESADEACRLPSSDPKAGGPLSWQMAVRLDSPQQTDILFTSGGITLLCMANRTTDGSFATITTAMGGNPNVPLTGDALTIETGSGSPAGSQYPTQLVVGRMPHATAHIEVITSDGQRRDATLGSSWYMVYADTTNGALVTEIDAYDSVGRIIARLANPNGVQPGASEAAS